MRPKLSLREGLGSPGDKGEQPSIPEHHVRSLRRVNTSGNSGTLFLPVEPHACVPLAFELCGCLNAFPESRLPLACFENPSHGGP